jgi:hypothetical protein
MPENFTISVTRRVGGRAEDGRTIHLNGVNRHFIVDLWVLLFHGYYKALFSKVLYYKDT